MEGGEAASVATEKKSMREEGLNITQPYTDAGEALL